MSMLIFKELQILNKNDGLCCARQRLTKAGMPSKGTVRRRGPLED